jgi:flagellar FliJ protein
MAGLKSIIRLRKFELDEKRRAVTELQIRLDNLLREEKRVMAALDAEKEHARIDDDTRNAFPNYNKRMQERLKVLRLEQTRVEAAIEQAREVLQEAFKEYKTFEITEENREKRAAAEEKRKEDATMDDIGIEGHRRKGK